MSRLEPAILNGIELLVPTGVTTAMSWMIRRKARDGGWRHVDLIRTLPVDIRRGRRPAIDRYFISAVIIKGISTAIKHEVHVRQNTVARIDARSGIKPLDAIQSDSWRRGSGQDRQRGLPRSPNRNWRIRHRLVTETGYVPESLSSRDRTSIGSIGRSVSATLPHPIR